jgi:hypothetical protein
MDDLRQETSLGKGPLASCSLQPFWWDGNDRRPSLDGEPASALPQAVDVAIIGGGYTGVSAALTLAKAGRSVAVLDARCPGFGCSSRNGGLLGPSFHKLGYQGLQASVGEAAARNILSESMDALAFAKDLIDAEAIDCGFHAHGRCDRRSVAIFIMAASFIIKTGICTRPASIAGWVSGPWQRGRGSLPVRR